MKLFFFPEGIPKLFSQAVVEKVLLSFYLFMLATFGNLKDLIKDLTLMNVHVLMFQLVTVVRATYNYFRYCWLSCNLFQSML